MFSHSTNCVGLFEMIEEAKLSEEKWCWSGLRKVRPAKRYNPEVNTADQAKQTFLQEELWTGLWPPWSSSCPRPEGRDTSVDERTFVTVLPWRPDGD